MPNVRVVRMLATPIVSFVVAAVSAVACGVGCEQEEFTPLPATAPSPSSRVPATRRALPTSDEIFGSRAATAPTTQSAAAATTTTRSTAGDAGISSAAPDPTDTPDQVVTRLFELMQKQDVTGVRTMLADPPEPERLRSEVALVAERMNRGATWQILDSRTEGVAAVVIFRTRFADGKDEFTPLPLVNRYDRWRVLMGQLNARKLTPGERTGIKRLAAWTEQRMNELRGVTTTSTAPAPKQ